MSAGPEPVSQGADGGMPVTAAYFFLSVLAGFLASGSLTLGSLTGVLLQPNAAKTGIIYAFGAGALLAALAVVLIAPTIANVSDPSYLQQHGAAQAKLEVIVLAVSSIVGGGVFVLLEELLSNRGAGIKKWLKSIKNVDMDKLGGRSNVKRNQLFGKSEFFGALTAGKRQELSREMRYVCYHPNDVIFAQGDDNQKLWVVKSGTVEMQVTPGESFHTHAVGDILGGLAFLTGQPQIMTAVATTDVEAYVVDYRVFISLMDGEPGLKVALMTDTANLLTLLANANRRSFAFRSDILVQWQARLTQLVRVAYRQATRSGNASGSSPLTHRRSKSTSAAPEFVTLRVRNTADSATPLTEYVDEEEVEEPAPGSRTPVSVDNTSFFSTADQFDTSVCSFHTAPSIARTSPAAFAPSSIGTDSAVTAGNATLENDDPEVVMHDNPLAIALEVQKARPAREADGVVKSTTTHSPSHDIFQVLASTLHFGTADSAEHFLQDLNSGETVPLSLDVEANNPLADKTPPNAASSAVQLKRLSAALTSAAAASAVKPSTSPEAIAGEGQHYECQITGQRIPLPEGREHGEGSDDDEDEQFWLCDYENITRSMRSGSIDTGRDVPAISQRAFTHSMSWHASGAEGAAGPAPTGVWLGNLLDGPAEAIVIGVQIRHALSAAYAAGSNVSVGTMIPWTLIAGLCLSNFPEAMAASMTMYQYGWSKRRVVLMWLALTGIISFGSGFGYLLASLLSHTAIVAVEGFASGGMLVMIIGSMIPEAAHLCGPNTTGMWLLAGFTAAYLFELLESN